MTAALPRTTLVRRFDTVRLIPSRFAQREDSVLASIAEDDAHLADLFELDNATNERLRAEQGLAPGIGVEELVFGVPNYRIVNAAFVHARPEGSRFNLKTAVSRSQTLLPAPFSAARLQQEPV